MYGIQDKINQILRGAETIRKNQSMLTAQSDSVELYNALCKATHEVARLRQALEFIAKDTATHDSTAYYRTLAQAALAPAPEEPVIKESLTTEPAPDWRELGPDEVIQEGDEYYTGKWTKITGWIGYPASNFAKVRTRRPLPKQEEMPLEDEIKQIETTDEWPV